MLWKNTPIERTLTHFKSPVPTQCDSKTETKGKFTQSISKIETEKDVKQLISDKKSGTMGTTTIVKIEVERI